MLRLDLRAGDMKVFRNIWMLRRRILLNASTCRGYGEGSRGAVGFLKRTPSRFTFLVEPIEPLYSPNCFPVYLDEHRLSLPFLLYVTVSAYCGDVAFPTVELELLHGADEPD